MKKKNTLLDKLKERRENVLLALIDTDNDNARSVYQFKLSQIDTAILEIERSLASAIVPKAT